MIHSIRMPSSKPECMISPNTAAHRPQVRGNAHVPGAAGRCRLQPRLGHVDWQHRCPHDHAGGAAARDAAAGVSQQGHEAVRPAPAAAAAAAASAERIRSSVAFPAAIA